MRLGICFIFLISFGFMAMGDEWLPPEAYRPAKNGSHRKPASVKKGNRPVVRQDVERITDINQELWGVFDAHVATDDIGEQERPDAPRVGNRFR